MFARFHRSNYMCQPSSSLYWTAGDGTSETGDGKSETGGDRTSETAGDRTGWGMFLKHIHAYLRLMGKVLWESDALVFFLVCSGKSSLPWLRWRSATTRARRQAILKQEKGSSRLKSLISAVAGSRVSHCPALRTRILYRQRAYVGWKGGSG
jgi:hypothetical protein